MKIKLDHIKIALIIGLLLLWLMSKKIEELVLIYTGCGILFLLTAMESYEVIRSKKYMTAIFIVVNHVIMIAMIFVMGYLVLHQPRMAALTIEEALRINEYHMKIYPIELGTRVSLLITLILNYVLRIKRFERKEL